ncbi:hypothetical protein TDB9533_04571 [Thalassocella blandensis]|nr:hypothetical protein TDB9533_04571 [Thalassocella blandensis]
MTKVRKLNQDFAVINPDKEVNIENVDSGLYERLNSQYNHFRGHELVSAYDFTEDWASWEQHPEGDEIVVLLAGQVTFVLELSDHLDEVTLSEIGSYVVVPKGVWHTAKIQDFARVMFITPGENTQHRVI